MRSGFIMAQEMDKGLGASEHYTPLDGWTPGDLEFFTVAQKEYSTEEHAVWKTLYQRQMDFLQGRAAPEFMDSLSTLGISRDRVPDFSDVNALLKERTGWKIAAVPGLIPDEPFFELLANRIFPVGNFIRTRDQLDYIQEPDIFHDLFGHVPLLAIPVFADYMQAYGHGGLKAKKAGALDKIARLYWYTVEFGLIRGADGLRIYGAGILSSPKESVFSLDDPSPHRIEFDLKRVLQTHFRIDDFQDNYFVIDSFEQLFEATSPDFLPIYKELENEPVYEPGVIRPGDRVIHNGTGTYALDADRRRRESVKK
jgi:phenylalanine-4-hydroxylase